MNKPTLLILLACLFFSTEPNAQNEDSGINLSKCDFESDAPAVIIFDKGQTDFYQDQDGFYINFQRTKRVKIFKESAFDQAEVSIDLYIGETDMEKVYDIKAVTYNLNGNKIETTHLDSRQIFKEPVNDYWYRKKFALPNIKEGCVIEYSYTIKTPFFMHLPDWEFQSDIPTMYSEYTVSMTPFYSYMYRAQGFSKFDVYENKKKGSDRSFIGMNFRDMMYKFGMKNISSFKDESYISSREDYIKKIDFQLSEINYPSGYSKKYMTTWPELSKNLLESTNFGRYIDKSEKIGNKQFEHLLTKSDQEKIDAVLDYMKSNYKPNGYTNKWASKSIKEFNKEKTGNTANINLMALGILRGIGIEAEPIIISTRNHGKVSDRFPFSDLFNNVIIMATVDGKKKLFDATDGYCPNNMLPAMCYNGKGYLVKKDSETWIQIKNHNLSTISTTIKYSLDPENNTLSGFGVVRNSGHKSIHERKKYNKDPEKFKQSVLDKGLALKNDLSVKDANNESKVFQYKFDFESKVDNIDGQIIFSPFFKFPDQTNPFKQEKRELAIDLIYPTAEKYTAEIEIPEGYKIEHLPEPYAKNSENTQMAFKAHKTTGNKILITATISLKKPVYSASVYPELKRLFNNAIEKLNQKIVIVKEDVVAMQSL
ncbi:DUF3857 domain-containing protein [Labilibacter marinus]|uniref:DUF3857 domain-containing protein n=1 Tax=Labilibacter marinus TaxID=1477105 RepID=UPI00083359A9|nr:DUF3857 domain-containing protein [Labilibacter marinus]